MDTGTVLKTILGEKEREREASIVLIEIDSLREAMHVTAVCASGGAIMTPLVDPLSNSHLILCRFSHISVCRRLLSAKAYSVCPQIKMRIPSDRQATASLSALADDDALSPLFLPLAPALPLHLIITADTVASVIHADQQALRRLLSRASDRVAGGDDGGNGG